MRDVGSGGCADLIYLYKIFGGTANDQFRDARHGVSATFGPNLQFECISATIKCRSFCQTIDIRNIRFVVKGFVT